MQLSTASLHFTTLLSAAFPPSPLAIDTGVERNVSVDDVLSALDEARNWVEENIEEGVVRQAIAVRLSIRFVRSLLFSLVSL